MWVPNTAQSGSWFGRHKVLTGVGAAVILFALIGIIGSAGGSKPATTSAPAATQSPAGKPAAKPAAKKPGGARIGQPVRDGKFEFTVTRVQPGVTQVGAAGLTKKAQGQFVLLHVTVKNIGGESQLFDGSSQIVYDAAGKKYSADSAAAIYLDQSQSFVNPINPGNAVAGIVAFDVPKTVVPVTAELHDSPFSGGVKVALR